MNLEIQPINLELSDNLKHIIQLQEYLQSKWDESILRVPVGHYCESSGEKCDKQCKFCKDEK